LLFLLLLLVDSLLEHLGALLVETVLAKHVGVQTGTRLGLLCREIRGDRER
jgi:hypothetical protein